MIELCLMHKSPRFVSLKSIPLLLPMDDPFICNVRATCKSSRFNSLERVMVLHVTKKQTWAWYWALNIWSNMSAVALSYFNFTWRKGAVGVQGVALKHNKTFLTSSRPSCDLALAVGIRQCHWDLELAVAVRQCPLPSGVSRFPPPRGQDLVSATSN